MPDSYGKRQRNTKKAKKFAEREERRATRKQQKAAEAAGLPWPPVPEGADEEHEDGVETAEEGSGAETPEDAGAEPATADEADGVTPPS
jgi:hypothetical protein